MDGLRVLNSYSVVHCEFLSTPKRLASCVGAVSISEDLANPSPWLITAPKKRRPALPMMSRSDGAKVKVQRIA